MNTDLKISKTKDKVVYFKNRPYCDEKKEYYSLVNYQGYLRNFSRGV